MSASGWTWWARQHRDLAAAPQHLHSRRAYPEAPTRSSAAPPPTRYFVVTGTTEADLYPYCRSWEQLAGCAAETNLFYEHWMLLPALRLYGHEHIEIALVLERNPNDIGQDRVIGVFPLEHVRRFRGLPIPAVRLWRHPHCFLCTPLLARNAQRPCWDTLFHWLAWRRGGEPLLELQNLNNDGTVAHALIDYLAGRERGVHVEGMYTRALLRLGHDAESYLRSASGNDHRREYARKFRRLCTLGQVQTHRLQPTEDAKPWVDAFLRLEACGWKGEAQTAMLCSEKDKTYFAEICQHAQARGRLLMALMELNHKPIAGLLGMYAGDGAFFLKTGYDEHYARYSPGMLLNIEMTTALHTERRVQWVDSCTAAQGGEAHKRIWRERKVMTSILCPTGKFASELLVSLIPLGRELRRMLRRR